MYIYYEVLVASWPCIFQDQKPHCLLTQHSDDNIKKYIVQSKKEAPSFIDKGRACVIETLTLP